MPLTPRSAPVLQSAVRLRGSPVEPGTIHDVAGAVPATAAHGLLTTARSGRFAAVQQAVTDLIADGYPAQEILLQLQGVLLEDGAASDSGACGWAAAYLQPQGQGDEASRPTTNSRHFPTLLHSQGQDPGPAGRGRQGAGGRRGRVPAAAQRRILCTARAHRRRVSEARA